MTVHRIIPAHPHGKHGNKTACGIELELPEGDFGYQTIALDGGIVRVSRKGEQFDCSRCRRVLEIRHG
ncbi:hypothetical protein [Bradyrhizobium sp. SZCCHNS1012]|uniref:hypothetical protein n=1 Tax=Bradyrhizobium sp. SZCCHNS1012 TaxID=3057297 RepID=UPI0029170966|nr:hypothetical protein [Bradyrhizobium sp. SZCCHNS1012]